MGTTCTTLGTLGQAAGPVFELAYRHPMPRIHGTPAVNIWNRGTRVQGPVGTGQLLVYLAFKFTAPGRINGLSFLRDQTDSDEHLAWLVHQRSDLTIRLEASATFRRNLPPTGSSPVWQTAWIRPWRRIVVGDLYELVIHHGNAKYSNMIAARSPDFDVVSGPITVPKQVTGTLTNGGTATTLTFLPGTSIGAAKPAIDVMFQPD